MDLNQDRIDHDTVPRIDLKPVLFGQATETQRHLCDMLAASAFGHPLSQDDFFEREEYMYKQSLAQNGGVLTWCLYCHDDESQVLATCKTIKRELLVVEHGESHIERGYCIGSVVTHPAHRGKGMASKLLKDLSQWLDGPAGAIASILYSNKEDFYMRCGWTPNPSPAIVLPASPPIRFDYDVASKNHDGFKFLHAEDIKELCDQDVDCLVADSQAKVAPEGRTILTVLPTPELIEWLHARAEFIGVKTHGKAPTHKGISYNNEAWMYWHHDFRKQQLFIQRLCVFVDDKERRQNTLATLLIFAMHEAKHWQLPSVLLWETGVHVREAVEMLKIKVEGLTPVFEAQRRETISVRWKRGEKKNVMISPNEHYSWN